MIEFWGVMQRDGGILGCVGSASWLDHSSMSVRWLERVVRFSFQVKSSTRLGS